MTHADFLKKFPPSCPSGYSRQDLEQHFGAKSGEPHPLWTQLNGQTQSICDGRSYNHHERKYYPTPCVDSPHGVVAYTWDVLEWYEGLPVSDW